jgi:hypothetical protein
MSVDAKRHKTAGSWSGLSIASSGLKCVIGSDSAVETPLVRVAGRCGGEEERTQPHLMP